LKKIAILGGGIAGLTAAYELARLNKVGANIEAVLFEASNRLGGIIETVHEQGFTIECGPDGWVTEKPWARELVEELGLAAEIIPSLDAGRKTYILQDGKLVAIPDGMRMMVPANQDALAAIEHSELFSEAAKAACVAEPERAADLRAQAPSTDESVAAFVRRHFGEEMLQKIGAPLLSGVFGGNVETLSVRAVMPAFVAMEQEHGSLIAALRARETKQQPIFSTLHTGLSSLLEAMISRIPADWIRLNQAVHSISRDGDAWVVKGKQIVDGERFDAVLLAAPADIARELLRPIDNRAAELMQMEASSAVVVGLGFAEKFALPQGFGFLAPEGEGSSLLACTFVDQKFPGRAPANTRLLRAFFGGAAAESITEMDDAAIAAIAQRELATILGTLPEPIVTVVRRWPRSLPQYAVGHLDRMAELDARIHALPNLHLLGNGYRGVGLPDVIRDARTAARATAK